MEVRRFKDSDAQEVAELHKKTTREINSKDYTPEQINAWSPGNLNAERWAKSLSKNISFVAVEDRTVVGFGDINHQGSLRRLYVLPEYNGRGIGTLIIEAIEKEAKKQGIKEIKLESTITAHKFYQKKGYEDIEECTVDFNGVKLKVFSMRKNLD